MIKLYFNSNNKSLSAHNSDVTATNSNFKSKQKKYFSPQLRANTENKNE